MIFTNLPDMPEEMSPEETKQANEWLQNIVATEVWTTADVCKKFNLSSARLNQLHKSHEIKGHIKLGATHFYIARYAGPWFEAYRKRGEIRKVKVAAKKENPKKPGRPKKNREEWRHTTFEGFALDIPEEFSSPRKWLEMIGNQQMKSFIGRLNSPEHLAWLETRKRLYDHFGISPDINI